VIQQVIRLQDNPGELPHDAGSVFSAVCCKNNVSRAILSVWWRDRDLICEAVESGCGDNMTLKAGKSRKKAWMKADLEDSSLREVPRPEWAAFERALDKRIDAAGDEGIDTTMGYILRTAKEVAAAAGYTAADGTELTFTRWWATGFLKRMKYTPRTGVDNGKKECPEDRFPYLKRWHASIWALQAGLIGGKPVTKLPARAHLPSMLKVGVVVTVKFNMERDIGKQGKTTIEKYTEWHSGRVHALPERAGDVHTVLFASDGKKVKCDLCKSQYGPNKTWMFVGEPENTEGAIGGGSHNLKPLWERKGWDEKYGRFTPDNIANFDQAPIYFTNPNKRVYRKAGKKRVRRQHAVMDGRVATLTITITASGRMKLMLIFHGKHESKLKNGRTQGLRADIEYGRVHNVDVTFQDKAWTDGDVSDEFLTTKLPVLWDDAPEDDEVVLPGDETHLAIADNLSSQTGEEYVRMAREKGRVLLWFLPPNCTDMLQPVDKNIAKRIQDDVKAQYEKWAEQPQNAARLRTEGLTASERRRMAILFVSRAADHIAPADIRHAFESTGCLIAANGDLDGHVQPQHTTPDTYSFSRSEVRLTGRARPTPTAVAPDCDTAAATNNGM